MVNLDFLDNWEFLDILEFLDHFDVFQIGVSKLI